MKIASFEAKSEREFVLSFIASEGKTDLRFKIG